MKSIMSLEYDIGMLPYIFRCGLLSNQLSCSSEIFSHREHFMWLVEDNFYKYRNTT